MHSLHDFQLHKHSRYILKLWTADSTPKYTTHQNLKLDMNRQYLAIQFCSCQQ